ncbi:HNH endonuclease [Amycolatopsis sp. YIM 10]|uniref:HNH endonuclease n=1 Tax=Amycolatopsis sp. YIM 10 TaxID=2653857 RepID=UPI00128FE67A|nr:HNH endonuclease signature motif containing protein [Amycolatopsis sp. YIM 10]QFU94090.1 HNH endonuclease [Amycolatopsis sp. YIM 10]
METGRLATPPTDRIELRFSGTYYFVYQLDSFMSRESILSRAFGDEFSEGLHLYVAPFKRWTTLHLFTEFFIEQVLDEDFDRASNTRYVRRDSCSNQYCPASPAWLLSVDLMKSHGFDVSEATHELGQWAEAGAYCCPPPGDLGTGPDFDICVPEIEGGDYADFVRQLTEEVFFVFFANRSFLYKFNSHLASWVLHSDGQQVLPDEDLFKKTNKSGSTLKRARIPEWAKRAVFFRDRGRCCKCERDLGGAYSPINRVEFDHIVPLAIGGLNDVTNLQMLCKTCNNDKRARRIEPGRVYERWFPMTEQDEYRFVPTLASVVASLTEDGGQDRGDQPDQQAPH